MRAEQVSSLVLERGLIVPEDLLKAREQAEQQRSSLEQVLVQRGLIEKEELHQFLAESIGAPYVELSSYAYDPDVVGLVPQETARQNRLFPLFKIRDVITVAMEDPTNLNALDQVGRDTELIAEGVLCASEDIDRLLDTVYGTGPSEAEKLIAEMGEAEAEAGEAGLNALESLAGESPITRLVDLVIHQAVNDRASDVHIEPEEGKLRIRFRIDGILHEVPSPPKHLELAIISRMKVLADMDIAEQRSPQDGHFQVDVEGRRIDFRVSVLPTIHGENVVLRLLDTSSVLLGLEQLGFDENTMKNFEEVIMMPHGILLTTGPTGSGKTTTLYSALHRINSVDRNIITVEDPVEYRMSLIRQVQVNAKAGISFASGLRSILRQDPDVIMVGEIRDLETGLIAVQSALTGHLVFSTLHTNDSVSAITRLVNMGVEPFLIAASLSGVVAQRLLRLICQDCKAPYDPGDALLEKLGLPANTEFYRGDGCTSCKGTGYMGRIGVYEMLRIDDELREMMIRGDSVVSMREYARTELGLKLLQEDGVQKVVEGLTTMEEVGRVAQEQVTARKAPVEAPAAMPVAAGDLAPVTEEWPPARASDLKEDDLRDYEQKMMSWLAAK